MSYVGVVEFLGGDVHGLVGQSLSAIIDFFEGQKVPVLRDDDLLFVNRDQDAVIIDLDCISMPVAIDLQRGWFGLYFQV